jgi:hypothetical protein
MTNILGATFTNTGVLSNSGTLINAGNFTNSGQVTISTTGNLTTSTNYTQIAGSTIVNGILTASGSAVVDIQGGILGGTGTINGNVMMSGILRPGDSGSPGTIIFNGNYEQTSAGILDELLSPFLQSFVNVNGNVMLDSGALLQITLLNGFNPLGQTFDLMSYQSLTGQFANGSSFWNGGYLWNITYGQNQIGVTAVQAAEPSSLLLLFIGLAALAFSRTEKWKRRSA